MKISGVSLIPAATPVASPVHHGLAVPENDRAGDRPAGLAARVNPVQVGTGRSQVPDDRCHQDQVDLAEAKIGLHRLGPQRDSRDGEQYSCTGVALRHADPAQGQPDRVDQRREADDGDAPFQEQCTEDRHQREDRCGERRIDERIPAGRDPVVERRRMARAEMVGVPDDQAAVAVGAEIRHPVQEGRSGDVHDKSLDRQGKRDRADDQERRTEPVEPAQARVRCRVGSRLVVALLHEGSTRCVSGTRRRA